MPRTVKKVVVQSSQASLLLSTVKAAGVKATLKKADKSRKVSTGGIRG